jgi:type III pantothenate kinase
MNLIVDIGNTRTKIAFFQKNTLVEKAILEAVTLDALSVLVKGRHIEGAIMSITGLDTEGVEEWLQKRYFFIKMATETPLPIENLYSTPQTLGKDRLAAVVAAQFLYPQKNCLVVDSGTCITYNFINLKGQFLGGNIAPGLSMRLKAMHHFTAKLPLIARNTVTPSRDDDKSVKGGVEKLVGQSTEQAMLNGAQIGLLSEVEGFVKRFKNEFGALKVLITGGDGAFLNDNLQVKNKVYEPNLVLMGLNRILNFNRE